MPKFNVIEFNDYKKDGYEEYDKGVLTITLPSWDDLYGVIQKLRDYKDYIWRGQRCDNWLLVSRFDRDYPREKLLNEHLNRFKLSIRGRRGTNPPKLDEDGFWALGQHYGLKTPLLDWTFSPFVAAYFSFIEEYEGLSQQLINELEKVLEPTLMERVKSELKQACQTEYRSVYGLSEDIVRWYPEQSTDRFVRFVNPPSDDNPRLIAQNGLFTEYLQGNRDVKSRVQRCYKKEGEQRIILIEIKIPNKDREVCLKSLNQMNINHLTLFPDIYGSAKFCNFGLEIDTYLEIRT